MNILPKLYLHSILECFGNNPPETIIVGGSYSTNEACRTQLNGKKLWLSDFDLLCINERPLSDNDRQFVYMKMWDLSCRLPQANPYFHIGLKLRSPDELEKEINSMYFMELFETGIPIKGNSLHSYLDSTSKSNLYSLNKTALFKKLYNWGLTRLWCNVLFFPIRAVCQPEWELGRMWYTYFVARGAMDWITWKLIESNVWCPTYRERFEIWQNRFCLDLKTRNLMKKCLDMRLGQGSSHIEELFPFVQRFSTEEIDRFGETSLEKRQDKELLFLKAMLAVIETSFNNEPDFSSLPKAKKLLKEIISGEIEIENTTKWNYWHCLRKSYSEFRFKRNRTDWIDHNVYTEHFLRLGSGN
jgi:hypothetical protein